LKAWIVDLCKDKDLEAIHFENGIGEIAPPEELVYRDNIYRFFLFPSRASFPSGLPLDDVRPRERGWITVRPGGIRNLGTKSVLLSSEIHGEQCDLGTGNSEQWMRWLKKRLTCPHSMVQAL
jgi:hypothetical protein